MCSWWFIFVALLLLLFSMPFWCRAQSNQNHLQLSVGALYERGFDATLSYEHETSYHNAWEFFANGYLKYDIDPEAGHVTKKSFWRNYRTWSLGVAYKPCVRRGRNHHGNFRIGIAGGSNLDHWIGIGTVGYEHTYTLRHGFELFFLVKEDVVISGRDMFRTGVALGFKLPM